MEFTPPKQLREREPATPAATVLRLIAYGGEVRFWQLKTASMYAAASRYAATNSL